MKQVTGGKVIRKTESEGEKVTKEIPDWGLRGREKEKASYGREWKYVAENGKRLQ